MKYDAIVIGAGSMGSATTYYLAKQGCRVLALEQFNIALRLNPSNAALIYNNRARVFQYQNQLELAADELEKGLTLEPKSIPGNSTPS